MARSSYGRSTRNFQRLAMEVHARGLPCCRCGQPIDYSKPYLDPITGRPDPEAKSIDHYPHPLATHPHLAEDPSNLASAHLRCNWTANKHNRLSADDLGKPSRDW